MCGRYALTQSPAEVEDHFGLERLDPFPPRYNIAPTQPILVIAAGELAEPGSNRPERMALLARWGFLPGWVKDVKSFPLLFNARSEAAAGKPAFRGAMRHRRILVPASGFYEWLRPHGKPTGAEAKAQAYWMAPQRSRLIAFAGILETYASDNGSEIDTAAILTTAASPSLARIHPRMPVVIEPEHYARWLDCRNYEPRHMADLLQRPEEEFFTPVPVSEKVNKVSNMGPDLQEPVEPLRALPSLAPAPRPGAGQLSLF